MGQSTNQLLMVRPANFSYNEETAANNAFQNISKDEDAAVKAIAEFDNMVAILRSYGISVTVIEDTKSPIKPDAIFPNNWFTTHDTGMLLLYPMYAPNRRLERRQDIIDLLEENYQVKKNYTLEHYEEEGFFLEGTGSLILDRVNKIVYASESPRTDLRLLDKWCALLGYDKVHFSAKDSSGQDIYHTNVLMALGTTYCILCTEAILDDEYKDLLQASLARTGKEVIDITLEQVSSFAGNMLEVVGRNDHRYLVMSESAYNSLTAMQKENILAHIDIIPIAIPTIEQIGGGSVRCMMAEIFLKPKYT
jgi:hypothetical protein